MIIIIINTNIISLLIFIESLFLPSPVINKSNFDIAIAEGDEEDLKDQLREGIIINYILYYYYYYYLLLFIIIIYYYYYYYYYYQH